MLLIPLVEHSDVFLAMFVFEYATTLDREIEFFWSQPVTGATCLFLCNRYTTLIFDILGVASYPLTSASDYVRICESIRHASRLLLPAAPGVSIARGSEHKHPRK